MAVVLFLLALASLAGGAAAAFLGSDILLADRGLPMIVAGGTVASAGLVLMGLAAVVRGLRRVERRLVSLGRVSAQAADETASSVGDESSQDEVDPGARVPGPTEEPQLRLPMPPPAPEERPPHITVVGRYASGGNSYVMYSDNSIDAETPAGRHRFASLDELRAFVAAGGERGEPS